MKDRQSFHISDELSKLTGKVDAATADIQWMKIALSEWNEATRNGEQVNEIMQQLAKDDDKMAKVYALLFHFLLEGNKSTFAPHCI